MLTCVTGVPGACKTAYVVTQLDNIERKNKVNLIKNIAVFEYNKASFDEFKSDFEYYEYETGSGHELKKCLEILPPEYFYILGQEFDDLRPDDYYLRSVRYNEIIERIRERGESCKFEYFQPVRTIYSNIKALKIDYARGLVNDWRECPDGSIIVIDEVQLVPPYNNNKAKDEPIVQELTIHRHRGFDFYFITQSPSYLHPTIKELISCHLHITRPYWRTPKVYQFGSLRAYPNTLVNKLNCESKFKFKPKDAIFKLYKSTSIDTSKKRFPAGILGFIAFCLFGLSIFAYGLSGGSGFLGHFFGKEEKTTVKTDTSPNASPVQKTEDLSLDCRKAVNVDTPQCKKWFDELSHEKRSLTATGAIPVSYDSNKPYDYEPQFQPPTPTDFPRMSGVIRMSSGSLMAVDQQGNYMEGVSQEDCKKWLSGYRPFNYFAQSQEQQSQRSAGDKQVSDLETSSL